MANYLLLIGINDYLYQKKLTGCVKDVTDVGAVLNSRYDFDEINTTVITNENATRESVLGALSKYCELGEEDNLVIYFSGHGHISGGRGYWVPVEGTSNYTTWISNDEIVGIFNTYTLKHLFVISDTCFSNYLLASGVSKSLAMYNARKSRWALTSSFTESWEPGDGTNSYFGEVVIGYLSNAAKDFRVSQLIEDVKSGFDSNVRQAPQGAPLMMEAHEGGEMIFEVLLKSESDDLNIYRSFITALKLYKVNGDFKVIDSYEDKAQRVSYELIQEYDQIQKKATFYLYLPDGSIVNKTRIHLFRVHKNITPEKLIVIVSKNKEPKALNYIKNQFRALNIFRINEFILDHCTPKFDGSNNDSTFLGINNFIQPLSHDGTNVGEHIEIVDDWIKQRKSPILVITGSGGVGKTTYSQYLADKTVGYNKNLTVFFIDSVRIKDTLLVYSKTKNLGVYEFYLAQQEVTNPNIYPLSEQLFKLNFDAGNFLLIIDGLDEIISKLPGFDVDEFLESIYRSSEELGSAKVIITCRSHFWDETRKMASDFVLIKLFPFNDKKCKEFFDASFDKPRISRRAYEMAIDFMAPYPTGEDYFFHPYVLDVIRSLMRLDVDQIAMDMSSFLSDILSPQIKTDYIIYRVCDREVKRIGQINVDKQIEFFVFLANNKRGVIANNEFVNWLRERDWSGSQIEALKSHPFLMSSVSNVKLKYDFLVDHFKSIYISNFFVFKSDVFEINEYFLDIVSEECYPDSVLVKDIVSRFNSFDDDDLLMVEEIISQVYNIETVSQTRKENVISNIFTICLMAYQKNHSNNITHNTKVLKSLFANGNVIQNMHIRNLDYSEPTRFDFAGMRIIDSTIVNFNSFYNCAFDEETKFVNCELKGIGGYNTNFKIVPEIFDSDCKLDDEMKSVFKDTADYRKGRAERCKGFLLLFFKMFYSNGRLGRQWEDDIIKPHFYGIDKSTSYGYKNIMKIMRRQSVVGVDQELGRSKMYIIENKKEDIVRFVRDGTMSSTITNLIKAIEG